MNIFVANIPFSLTDDQLEDIFSQYGEISSAKIIKDKETGRSRGFGFVEMDDEGQGSDAVESLDGYEVDGRQLKVKKAYPKKQY